MKLEHPKVKRLRGCGDHGFAGDGIEIFDSWCPACQKWPDRSPPLSPAQREALRQERSRDRGGAR